MSHPPDYPGRKRLKRITARAGSDAYQGALEAVGAVLVSAGFGFWFDKSQDTAPWGLVVGVVIGFAAMVLRLVRLGEELHPDKLKEEMNAAAAGEVHPADDANEDEFGYGMGLSPALSDPHEDDDPSDS